MATEERLRWLIPGDDKASGGSERSYWEHEHRDNDYATTFSVGEDAAVRHALVDTAIATGSCGTVLIAGCGSRTDLQEELLARGPETMEVVGSDYPQITALAEERYTHERLRYLSIDDPHHIQAKYDLIVAVNVLIMEHDGENRRLLSQWSDLLTTGGTLVALVPSLWCGYDLATLSEREDLRDCLDLEGSSWTEKHQGIRQIEYSPLRMRRILKEASLRLVDMRIVFLEGKTSREQCVIHYGIDDDDLLIYEHLISARRE